MSIPVPFIHRPFPNRLQKPPSTKRKRCFFTYDTTVWLRFFIMYAIAAIYQRSLCRDSRSTIAIHILNFKLNPYTVGVAVVGGRRASLPSIWNFEGEKKVKKKKTKEHRLLPATNSLLATGGRRPTCNCERPCGNPPRIKYETPWNGAAAENIVGGSAWEKPKRLLLLESFLFLSAGASKLALLD